ncbi:MAG: D-alanyl-D-alanine carboxypeptidase/D-alanyl-D-alanine-endopeptidase [Bdellovibrionaceae bacterium]|nr:D-alanyl-D-alanine carboxypeptidase/D-alanyl-D-alanine-endopeptidase [Pseudobdellovibrionaceae bacterium]MBC7457021.1 D-alanyl-D-alanine carboxypeptidase/D-alanyl-D-alanine-endopeptidase [Pseudobdellovibrionaceae bacterium]
MKRLIKFTIPTVLFLFTFCNLSLVEAKKSKSSAATKTDGKADVLQILKKYKIDSSDVSLEVRSEDGVVEALNPKQTKIPASVTKILTTFAVLQTLPPGFKFKTQLFYDGTNLYLKGSGDPSFVSEKMWYLVNEFTRAEIKSVKDIIVDDTLFDQVRFDESRESKRVDRAYDAPVGAMSFNWNAVNVFVKPNEVGKKAHVFVDPESDAYTLVNQTVTVASSPKKDLIVSISNADRKIIVSGEVSKNADEKGIFKSVAEPDIWSGIQLKAFLKQRSIESTGSVKKGQVPQLARLVATSESKSLAEVLSDMNKFSNNFVAEMLIKNLAAQEVQQNASLKKGVEVIRSELKKIGLTNKDFEIDNPSGLTRENLLSAYALNEVLIAIKNDFTKFPVFVESLPIAGVDGTLKKRMKNSVAEGWVRAKTGHLDGVTSLAGYAGKKNGDIYTFSFLYNGPKDATIVREAFDQIVISILQ